jgi:integrase
LALKTWVGRAHRLTRIVEAPTIAGMAYTQLDLWAPRAPAAAHSDAAAPRSPTPPVALLHAVTSTATSANVITLRPWSLGLERVAFYTEHARAKSTRAAYALDMAAFCRWCEAEGLCALPASYETLAVYLTEMMERGRKASTVRRARIAIGMAHATAGLPRPDRDERIRTLERGMGRIHGAKEQGARPLLHKQLEPILQTLRSGARDDRDRALLLLGFWGAFRSGELVALRIEDLELETTRLRVHVRRSKEDQLGLGALVSIDARPDSLCAVRAVERWLKRVGETSGPLLRTVSGQQITGRCMPPRGVSRVIQRLTTEAALGPGYSARGLRAGLATSAYASGVDERMIQAHGRWKDRRSLDRYIDPVALSCRPSLVSTII